MPSTTSGSTTSRSVDAAVRFVSAPNRCSVRWTASISRASTGSSLAARGTAARPVGHEWVRGSPRSVRRRRRALLLQAMGWPHAQGRWARTRWCASRRAARIGGLVGHGRPGLLRIEEPAGGAEARFADALCALLRRTSRTRNRWPDRVHRRLLRSWALRGRQPRFSSAPCEQCEAGRDDQARSEARLGRA